jgi:hypothetical protein
MTEDREKRARLLAYWLFSTVVIVFASITAYIAIWTRPIGAPMMTVIKAGLPIWGIVALAAVIIYSAYLFFTRRKF